MALDALAGALMVISTVPSFTHMMLRREWLILNHGSPELFVQDFQQMLDGSPRMRDAFPDAVVTELFALPIGTGQFPADPKDFRPFVLGSNPRLLRHFGNY